MKEKREKEAIEQEIKKAEFTLKNKKKEEIKKKVIEEKIVEKQESVVRIQVQK